MGSKSSHFLWIFDIVVYNIRCFGKHESQTLWKQIEMSQITDCNCSVIIGSTSPDLGSDTRLAPQSPGLCTQRQLLGCIQSVIQAGELISPAFQTIYILV